VGFFPLIPNNVKSPPALMEFLRSFSLSQGAHFLHQPLPVWWWASRPSLSLGLGWDHHQERFQLPLDGSSGINPLRWVFPLSTGEPISLRPSPAPSDTIPSQCLAVSFNETAVYTFLTACGDQRNSPVAPPAATSCHCIST